MADVPGMAFPPMKADPIPGVSVYPQEPVVEDRASRGDLTGTRVDTQTYLFESPGAVQLPDVILTWWDLDRNELKREELSGLSLEIAPNPEARRGVAGESSSEGSGSIGGRWWLIVSAALALGLLALLWRCRIRIVSTWRAWRIARDESEPAAFRRFRSAARRGDPRRALTALMAWLDRAQPESPAPSAERFLAEHGDASSQRELAALVRQAYEPTAKPWSGRPLLDSVSRARTHLHASGLPGGAAEQPLPPLNPTRAPEEATVANRQSPG